MKIFYILISILLLSFGFNQTEQVSIDIEKIHKLRSDISKDIIQINQDGSKSSLGRCGFIDFRNTNGNIPMQDIEGWKLRNTQRRDISIPISFHVIYSANEGYISQSEVNEQIDVLNLSFAPWGISFTLSTIDWTQNSNWFNNDSEHQYKSTLAVSPSTTLNIYTTTAGGYLGYAYLPNTFDEGSYMHGVVLNYQTLPDVYNWEYDAGDTGVHEVGHYLGLYHTFEGGCYGNGDEVSDTPAQDDDDNIYNCWTMDTCSSSGSDPIHNYMNYTDDACLTEFTSGQSSRMDYMLDTYKPNLGTQIVDGCTDPLACNYDPEATIDDDSCAYEVDCAGTCGGDLEADCCGVCGGDNSQCSNCCGMPFPEDCSDVCYEDYCGVCDDIPENDCAQDCSGVWGGTALLDNCGICDSDPTNDCGYECGSWGGDAFLDECGICHGDGPEEHFDCEGNCLVEFDCAGNCCVLGEEGCYWQETGPCGEPAPSDGMDSCGVCGGDNTSCMDCSGVPCSDAYMDNCGVCDDIPENDCVQGCDGGWGSGVELDECGICGGDGASCADADSDGCIDGIDDAPYEWDDDYDGDSVPDDCDADDDNDGAMDSTDSDDNNEYVCSDIDGDTCDDCSTGTYDSTNDGEDYDADGICNLGDDDDDNDGAIDSEDCHPFDSAIFTYDCCGVCGGDNSSCSNCCGIPFGDDCASDCVEDDLGACCLTDDIDLCGICFGEDACLACESPFIDIDGHCLHQDDIAVLQQLIDNSVNSGFSIDGCDSTDPWCSSPNLSMDQSDSWHDVAIDGINYQFSNDNGVVEPLELGLQDWTDGRLTSLMCGAYIYCQLSGEIPEVISDLSEIEILRLEVNYFTGEIPESVCGLENINFSDDLAFDFSYNMLCPPYPECVPDGAVQYMDTSECWLNGDVNVDGEINVLDIVSLVDAILNGIDIGSGDINGDNVVNIIDVVMLVDMILTGG